MLVFRDKVVMEDFSLPINHIKYICLCIFNFDLL